MSTSAKLYFITTILVALWCAGIIAAPALRDAGLQKYADSVYSFYSRVCHQSDARSFHIDEGKFGVCIRCTSIYFGFLAGLLLMPLSGPLKRCKINKSILLMFALIPMLADVILNNIGVYNGTTMTRMLTGIVFGCTMPFYIAPIFIEAYSQIIRRKKTVY